MSTNERHTGGDWTPIETALRFLGTRNHGEPVELLRHAMERPAAPTGRALAPLIRGIESASGWSVHERAAALWKLVGEGVEAPDVGPTRLSRRRRALYAAFRMPDPDLGESWKASLHDRFLQLKRLSRVFGDPTSTQPMETAWRRGVGALATYLDARFQELDSAEAWAPYRPANSPHNGAPYLARSGWEDYFGESDGAQDEFRNPSEGAQPVFVNLFVTTVFMRRRAVYRRITERLVTARKDGVRYYTARGFAGKAPRLTYVPVQALWGCTAEFVEVRAGRPPVTRLWFPNPLRAGDQAHFASEIVDENIAEERYWVDVDIDHHGIARGAVAYGGRVPVSGLTIRVRFDDGHLPDAVWWYAESNENERYDRPPEGDPRLLEVSGQDVQHTFTDRPCQPRESYGLAFSWPPS